jgi:hypothetical protein
LLACYVWPVSGDVFLWVERRGARGVELLLADGTVVTDGVNALDSTWALDRDYLEFALLGMTSRRPGVRPLFPTRGLPNDASSPVKQWIDYSGMVEASRGDQSAGEHFRLVDVEGGLRVGVTYDGVWCEARRGVEPDVRRTRDGQKALDRSRGRGHFGSLPLRRSQHPTAIGALYQRDGDEDPAGPIAGVVP